MTPTNRSGAAAASAGKKVVVFGGLSGGFALGETTENDTWTWNGGWFQPVIEAEPMARQGAAVAYYPATRSVVIFGGDNGCCTRLNDTWRWSIDDNAWTQVLAPTSPPARSGATMAHDAATGTLVLFGGLGPPANSLGDSPVRLDDTWTFDGTTWTPRTPDVRPPGRADAAMASLNGQVVLFGGQAGVPQADLGDTWTWNGAAGTWTPRAPATGPSARHGAVMTYHPPSNALLLFGGASGNSIDELNDTWLWNGTKWKAQAPVNKPSPRMSAAMAHHKPSGTTLLFGGARNGSPVGETWIWNGVNWKRKA